MKFNYSLNINLTAIYVSENRISEKLSKCVQSPDSVFYVSNTPYNRETEVSILMHYETSTYIDVNSIMVLGARAATKMTVTTKLANL